MKKNKLGYYFIKEFLKNYLSILLAFGLIIWITQAVRLLDLIGEEGNSVFTYFRYIALILPKFFSRISLIIFFICFIVTIIKFEDHNELKAVWLSGFDKKHFIIFLLKSSMLLIVILITIRTFVIPYFTNSSRYLLLNSGVGSIGPLLKQNNFNNPLKKLTIYVGKKNKINELEEIILFEDTPELKKTIIAKSGVAVNDNNKNLLVLVDGSIQEERKDRKISILDFDKTTLDLSQYNKKTIDYYKFNEMFVFDLIKLALDEKNTQRTNAIGELNDRIIMPLFIPFLIILSCFLIITNKDIVNYNLLKIVISILGFGTLILSEVLLDLSSKKLNFSFALYITPLIFFLISWIVLSRFLNKENTKS
jgi:lipopolysaccharide export LptBFGC system permease protein LptF